MAKAPRFLELTPDTPFDRSARIIVRGLLARVVDEAPAVLAGDDVRAVHDMRVAVRRLRTALRTFEGTFRKRALEPHREALRRVGRRLGVVRDADVHLAALRTALAGATSAEAPGIAHAIETLVTRRRLALASFAIELSQLDRDAFAALAADA